MSTDERAMVDCRGRSHDAATPSLWVIVPAHDEAASIGATLGSLAAQTDTDFVLVIVDNASTDATADVARAIAHDSRRDVLVLDEPQKGVGCAVDTAVRYAIAHGATWIARTDADSVPDSDWIVEVKRALGSGTELAIGSMRARRDENGLAARAAFRVAVATASLFGRLRPQHRSDGLPPYRMHAGFNMAMTADLYERCGGMPRRPSPTDRTFMNRARAAGATIRRHPAMRVGTSLRRFRALGILGTARWYLDRGATIEDPR